MHINPEMFLIYLTCTPIHLNAVSSHLTRRQKTGLQLSPTVRRKERISFPAVSEFRSPLEALQMPVDAPA